MTPKERLDRALEAHSRLSSEIQRIEGRKQAAQENLSKIQAEIRQAGYDPDTLEEHLRLAEKAFLQEMDEFETALRETAARLKPYKEA